MYSGTTKSSPSSHQFAQWLKNKQKNKKKLPANRLHSDYFDNKGNAGDDSAI